MLPTVLLGTALAAGQMPPGYYYQPAQAVTPAPLAVRQPAAPMPPAAPPTNGGSAAASGPDKAKSGGPGTGTEEGKKADEEKKDDKKEDEKKDEKEPPKYLLERLMEGSVAGKTLLDNGIKVYGWADMNYTGSSARRSNAPITFNDRANFFQFNQNWIEIAKSIDTSKDEVQWGFKTSWIVPGYDYKYTLARGLWDGQLRDGRQYGFDAVYHYAELFAPGVGAKGTTFRLGRWATGIGYEQIDAVNTPYVTKSYNFQYNPFTHTGAMATTGLSDDWTMYHGVVTGADVWIDPAATASYVGGLKWAPKEGKTSVAANVFFTGKGFNAGQNFQHFNAYNLVVTRKFGEKLTYVLDATASNAVSTDPNGPAGGRAANWYGFANYFLYQATEKLASNLRVEIFNDSQGVRTGTRGTYFETTYGLTWTPIDPVLVRPFVRYDHNGNGPYEGRNSLYTGGLELIFRY
jgi:hypothetical protein